ncbi:peptidylprolyl isomerase [Novosphingobium sp. PhB165]|uniref:peptidylprolyl isomerase n=1 Tax=Novosphingobium sp. PhB165 TaxID=2485105 RepID=UPI001050AEC9|nr:peptidylprolyl isomerase [Novosphingobium sp. PhB165]TCM21967.1 peptidylprolyl isomerase [Novosphingobium sp. PhB165]
MKFRLNLTATMIGLALVATPAMAKKKEAPAPATAAEPAAPPLSVVVDPDVTHDPENVLLLDLSDGGRVAIRLMPKWAPHHVERIKTLAAQGFYNGIIFHRVIDGFMAQTGDPTGTGQGGSKLPDLQAEFNSMPHLRGMVSMARTNDPNSANSQFFIVLYPRFSLDHKYTVFGRVISGMQYVDAIQRGEPPANPTKIVQASLASDNKAPPPAAPATAAPAKITADQLSNSKSN